MDNANDFIIIRGARENNLKNIDINIPKGKIVVFAGASGSGKSSLVFNTVASEAMRELYDTFPLYVRNRMPYYPAADVEEIENLTTPIIVRQRPVTGDFALRWEPSRESAQCCGCFFRAAHRRI